MDDSTAEQTLIAGTVLGGKFRVVRVIGTGGMGAVYEVQHTITKHHRALKLLHSEVRRKHPQIVTRFLREASVAGTLGDPHIVETFDAGELPSGEPYLVMELLDGDSLSARIARGRLSIEEACAIVLQLCEAIGVAHAHGIIHRDLKPDNVFLCKVPSGFVKVLDFGISKFDPSLIGTDGAAQTQEGTALGTPYYMPPEQVRGMKDLDARADVYAIGVILYESLTGKRPFDADSLPHLMVLIHEGKYPPLRSMRAEVTKELAAIVDDAMRADRDLRIASVGELGKRLGSLSLANTALASQTSLHDIALDKTDLGSVGPPLDLQLQKTEMSPAESRSDPFPAHSTIAVSASRTGAAMPTQDASHRRLAIGSILLLVIGVVIAMLVSNRRDSTPAAGPAAATNSVASTPASASLSARPAETAIAILATPPSANLPVPSSSMDATSPSTISISKAVKGASSAVAPKPVNTASSEPMPSSSSGRPPITPNPFK